MKQTKLIKRILGLSLAAIMATGIMPVTAYAKGFEESSVPFNVEGLKEIHSEIEINPNDESRIIKITRPCIVIAAFECRNAEQEIGILPMKMALNYELLLNESMDFGYCSANKPTYSSDSGDFEYVKYTVTEEDIANAGGKFILYCRARAIMYPQETLSQLSKKGQKSTLTITCYEEDPLLIGYTLSLDGDIGANFYMQLSSALANSETAYMQFTMADGTMQTIPVKDAERAVVNDISCCVFRCDVPAKNMTDTITAQIINGNTAYEEYRYTVKEYAEYLLANQNNPEYAEAVPMVKAMLNYGSYAQIYFNHNTNNLANDTVYMTDEEKDVSSVTADTLAEFNYQYEQKCDSVRFEGASLDLLSKTTLRLWYTADEETIHDFNVTYYQDDTEKAVKVIRSGQYYYIDISNISAKDLDCQFFINFANDDSEWYSWYSVMAYCYNVLSRETTDARSEQLKDTVRALYLYNQAAKEYFA